LSPDTGTKNACESVENEVTYSPKLIRLRNRWTVDGLTPGKYPIGGSLNVGSAGWPSMTTLPDRFNHNGTLAFNGGGFMQYNGQALDTSLTGQALVEQVKQIRFNPGMSELGLANGNGVSSSTTLLANDATSAMVRQQGATFMIGGDVPHAWAGLGSLYKLKFSSGMTSQLKGGGGAAGSQSVSIIPWMTCGTIYHPSQGLFVTYDNTNGVRALTASEYYTGTVYGAAATVNVKASSLDLGTNHTQTINSYVTDPYFWGNTDIGPGSTLTVASGLVSFQGAGTIGDGTPANAGTLNFGTSEGIIWTAWQAYTPNVIGSLITGSGGLTTAGTNVMILKAANTYTGKTVVGAGILQIGDGTLTTSRLGVGNLEVTTGATLRIKSNVANGIADTAIVGLDNAGDVFFGRMELESGINETVAGLWLGGVCQPSGTYGSSSSSATYKYDSYFSGTGILTSQGGVAPVPEPTVLALLGLSGLLLGRRRR
jgi:autotransporter-associated beta strand protein